MSVLILAIALFWQGENCRSCDLLANVASALSEGNDVRFMGYMDSSASAYGDIQANVRALTAQSDVSASLDVLTEAGDDQKVEVLVDWFMQITSKDGTERVDRRRMRVKVTERKTKGEWKVAAIDPLAILAPVSLR